MTYMTGSGRILIFSILLFAACAGPQTGNTPEYDGLMFNMSMKAFRDGKPDYTIDAESVFTYADTMTVMHNIHFMNAEGQSDVEITSDRAYKTDSCLTYKGNVTVFLEDSMILYTDSILYSLVTDSVMTEDSILIEKDENRMRTKGMLTDCDFNRIVFYNPVLIYDE